MDRRVTSPWAIFFMNTIKLKRRFSSLSEIRLRGAGMVELSSDASTGVAVIGHKTCIGAIVH